MDKFIQLHMLKAYPTSNLNRDDLGAPKKVNFGGSERLRISSQCLKRNYRMGFGDDVRSVRTRLLPHQLFLKLVEGGVATAAADKAVHELFRAFFVTKEKTGKSFVEDPSAKKKVKEGEPVAENQVKHQLQAVTAFSGDELDLLYSAVDTFIEFGLKSDEFIEALSEVRARSSATSSIDLAAFGRMVAGNTMLNVEAAVQVAHAFTISESEVDDDYFTAVDDMNIADNGSAHLDSRELGSGIFYHYMLIDTEKLTAALGSDADISSILGSLAEAFIHREPTGYQNSCAAHARACCVMTEIGSQSPRSLANAFFTALPSDTSEADASACMEAYAENMNKCYDESWKTTVMDFSKGGASIKDVIQAVKCVAE